MSADDARPAFGPALLSDLPPRLAQMDPEMFRRRFNRGWRFEVADAFDITPHMRRVIYTAEDMGDLTYKPGQEIILLLPGADAPRHYTIRSLDRATGRLAVDFVLHGDSVAGRHAKGAKPGETITVLGPRGRHVIRDGADWRLFIGDESALPAIFAMVESLPAGAKAQVFLEIGDDSDKQSLQSPANVTLTWLQRGGVAAGQSRILAEAVAAYALPPGVGHIYTLGETSVIRTIRQSLIARGVPKDLIAAEGYWRPGREGGHEHVDD